jgi:hypothetical protein
VFRLVQPFHILPLPGLKQAAHVDELTAVPSSDGTFGLIEFTRALPRAKLYSKWQVTTNDDAVLKELASRSFDPEQSVFVAGSAPVAPPVTTTNAGNVAISHYSPKAIALNCYATAPSVLLLNDRFEPNWKVQVDGKPETLLRCNYIMRGVYLSPGTHTVEFRFQPPLWPLYVSLAAIGSGLAVLGMVVVTGRANPAPVPAPAPPTRSPLPPGVKVAPACASGGLRRRVGLRGAQ